MILSYVFTILSNVFTILSNVFMILSNVFTMSNLRILKPNSCITCER